MKLRIRGASIRLRLKRAEVDRIAAGTDAVSLHAEQKVSGAADLSLLIENDFSCLEPGHHRDGGDDQDTFPHPSAQSHGS